MRKLLLVVISLLFLPLSATVSAQRVVAPPKPKVVATPTPEPKRSVISRIFGRRDKAEAPTPAAKPADAKPTPRPKTRPKPRTPAPKRDEPAETEEPKPAPAVTPTTENQPPAPPKTEPATSPGPVPGAATPPEPPKPEAAEAKPAASAKRGSKTPPASKLDTAGMDEATKFRAVKAVAQEDAKIKELQAKAESAITDSEAHAASVAYNRALFRKVRDLEPSLDGYVDRLEDAMMKRLNSEKKRD